MQALTSAASERIVTVGVDMSTDPRKVGLVRLTWSGENASLEIVPVPELESLEVFLREQARCNALIAVDAPFGWPLGFGPWLTKLQSGPQPLPPHEVEKGSPWAGVAARRTDYAARRAAGMGGFNVSFDKFGATGARWAEIEYRLHQESVTIDRSGQAGRFFETWPAAAWRLWSGKTSRRSPTKYSRKDFGEVLLQFVNLSEVDEWAKLGDSSLGHVKDALVCALVARELWDPSRRELNPEDSESARHEGWIHLPLVGAAEASPLLSVSVPAE
jgi:hypothetical protein